MRRMRSFFGWMDVFRLRAPILTSLLTGAVYGAAWYVAAVMLRRWFPNQLADWDLPAVAALLAAFKAGLMVMGLKSFGLSRRWLRLVTGTAVAGMVLPMGWAAARIDHTDLWQRQPVSAGLFGVAMMVLAATLGIYVMAPIAQSALYGAENS